MTRREALGEMRKGALAFLGFAIGGQLARCTEGLWFKEPSASSACPEVPYYPELTCTEAGDTSLTVLMYGELPGLTAERYRQALIDAGWDGSASEVAQYRPDLPQNTVRLAVVDTIGAGGQGTGLGVE